MTADFVKNDLNCEEIDDFLLNVCSIAKSRVQKYLRCYENNKLYIQFSLLNIGTYLPHITDVRWKMEYILKVKLFIKKSNSELLKNVHILQSSMVTESDGPIFRISLVVEKFNEKEQCNKINNINFTCTAQELQDLVYKLKDAVRHCNSISSRNSQFYVNVILQNQVCGDI